MSILLNRLGFIFGFYGVVGTPEVVIYGADLALPPQLRTSQVSLFGNPYYVDFAGAGETVYASGWVDVAGNQKVRIRLSVDSPSEASGDVLAKFLVGNNLASVVFDDADTSFNITVTTSGAGEVTDIIEVAIGQWRYIRLYSITNSSGKSARVRIYVLTPAQPVIITPI